MYSLWGAKQRINDLESEVAVLADPFVAAWESARGQIAEWTAIRLLLVEKGILTEQEIADRTAEVAALDLTQGWP